MFGLQAAVAIRLRSICTGSTDFVLEFFLPVKCKDPDEQRDVLTSLSSVIQNVCQTLRVVTDKELKEEREFLDKVGNPHTTRSSKEVLEIDQPQLLKPYATVSSCQNGQSKILTECSDATVSSFQNGKSKMLTECADLRVDRRDSTSTEGIRGATNPSSSGDHSTFYTKKIREKRHVKAEKTITLQVLRQHFSGSLEDAAKTLGVCPTTLKRICRHHGIQRWPSRKIKKVGHSLQKIQRVIDSVEAASGVLQIESFYSNFPELASPNESKVPPLSDPNSNNHMKSFDAPGSDKCTPPTEALESPSSSFCQTSISSQSSSSGTQPHSYTMFGVREYPTVKEERVKGILKRTRSDANLHLSSNGPKLLLRSQSHVSFRKPTTPDNLQVVVDGSSQKIQATDVSNIKVTYGEDVIRFRVQNSRRYKDLFEEISKRFGIRDTRGFSLKYLDDDAEWVLLTCNADLEECIDVCRASRSHTIKLSFGCDSQSQSGNRSFDVTR